MSKYVGFRLGKVHESHVISEYYCGGCGYPVTDHDSFCPECGGAFRESDASDLEAENAKLREHIHKLEMEGSDHFYRTAYAEDANRTLEAENAKLRVERDEWHRVAVSKQDIIDHTRNAMAENAKLRGICAEVAGILFNLEVDRCGLCQRDSISHPCPVHTIKGGECLIKSELRELGVDA